MAASKPIIATNVSAIPEIVTHQESGFLVPSGQPMVMSKYMHRFENNEDRFKMDLVVAINANKIFLL